MSIETPVEAIPQADEVMVLIPSPDTLAGPKYTMEPDEDVTLTVAQLGFAIAGAPTQEMLAARTHSEAGLALDSLRGMLQNSKSDLERNKKILEAIHAYDAARLEKLLGTALEISTQMDALLGKRNPVQANLDAATAQQAHQTASHEQLLAGMSQLEEMKSEAQARQTKTFEGLIDTTSKHSFQAGHVEGETAARYKSGPTEDEFHDMLLQGDYAASGFGYANYQRTFVESDATRQEKAEREAALARARATLQELVPEISGIDNSIGAQQLSIDQTQALLDRLSDYIDSRNQDLQPLDEEIMLLNSQLEGLKLSIIELYTEFSTRQSPLRVIYELLQAENEGSPLAEIAGEAQRKLPTKSIEVPATAEEVSGEILSDTTIQAITERPLMTPPAPTRTHNNVPEPLAKRRTPSGLLEKLSILKRRGQEG